MAQAPAGKPALPSPVLKAYSILRYLFGRASGRRSAALAAAIKVILNNDSSALHFQLSGEIPELLEKRPCALRRPWKDKQRSSVALLKV